MTRQIVKIAILCLLVAGGSVAVYRYEKSRSAEAKLQEQVQRLERQRQHLQDFVSRLTSEKRVAEIIVTDQILSSGGHIESTTLMFVEYGRDAKQLPPKFFTIKGNVAHIDALVIKFDRDLMEQNDPLRGHSLVLFYRIFGDYQAPVDGFRIDTPGTIPEVYRGDPTLSPEAYQFEAELWENFWRLASDPDYRKDKGVRLAQGESPWTYFYPESIYTITMEAAGGLSIHQRPIDGIWKEFREALGRQKLQHG
jgi:hypothetical protein